MNKSLFLIFVFAIFAVAFAIDSKCLEPVVTGPCRASMQKYAYKGPGVGCQTFTYGGCQGSGNNFNSLAECQQACS